MSDIDEQDGPMGQTYGDWIDSDRALKATITSVAFLILMSGMLYSRCFRTR